MRALLKLLVVLVAMLEWRDRQASNILCLRRVASQLLGWGRGAQSVAGADHQGGILLLLFLPLLGLSLDGLDMPALLVHHDIMTALYS